MSESSSLLSLSLSLFLFLPPFPFLFLSVAAYSGGKGHGENRIQWEQGTDLWIFAEPGIRRNSHDADLVCWYSTEAEWLKLFGYRGMDTETTDTGKASYLGSPSILLDKERLSLDMLRATKLRLIQYKLSLFIVDYNDVIQFL